MSGRFLLDTNIVIALFANEAAVVAQLQAAEEVFVPDDLWIAAVATQYGLTLVSRDLHFGEIDSLAVQLW